MDSKTNLYGLIGLPIGHSYSPLIHNYLFSLTNINGCYLCFPVKPKQLKFALYSFKALGVKGFNVTIPYKVKIMKYLAHIDKNARIIGAVNTIKEKKGKLYGFNTDVEGFKLSLEKIKFSCSGKSAFIIGAGGAARAVSVGLAQKEIKLIYLYDLIAKNAFGLVKQIAPFFPKTKFIVIGDKKDINLKSVDIIVNASGVGLHKEDKIPWKLEAANRNVLVYDLIYNPSLPILLFHAKQCGLRIMNGLYMLVAQAIKAQQIWQETSFDQSLTDKIYHYLRRKIYGG